MGQALRVLCLAVVCFGAAVAPERAAAQSNPLFVRLTPATGALYKPDTGPAPHVGLIVMHRTANYLTHPACTELSRRGFMVLCMNSRFANNESQVRWEQIALDVKLGMEFLRAQAGITKVVLFGHSGGGPTMSFYQALAENGPAYCRDPKRLVPCTADLSGLPPADGIVFADAHPGQPVMVMRALMPVANENNPPDAPLAADLDPLRAENGYSPNGVSHYSADFVDRYLQAQARRMNRIIDDTLGRLERIKAGTYPYADDDLVVIPRAGNPGAGPYGTIYINQFDPGIARMNSTVRPQKVLKNDGSVVTEIARSVIVPEQSLTKEALSFGLGTKVLTLRSFMSANAVRATNSADAIDHCTSNNSTTCAIQSISVPVMFAGMGAFVFVRDNEVFYDLAKSRDKDLIYIEGATHGFTGCKPCEVTPGQYANSAKNFFDYVAGWINARF
jgi:pimeloyl-ACP methyl ester carboxylesterase